MKQDASKIPLVPFADLEKSVKKILSTSKEESDKQIAEIQHANTMKRRAAKKKAA